MVFFAGQFKLFKIYLASIHLLFLSNPMREEEERRRPLIFITEKGKNTGKKQECIKCKKKHAKVVAKVAHHHFCIFWLFFLQSF